MKPILLFLLITYSSILYAQVPNQINYQGIARNALGNVLPGKNISIRLSIHEENATGTVIYREVRNVTTSKLGMFSIAIGSTGAVDVTGTIAGINWSLGAKFLQVEIDPNGGSNFIDLGSGQLLSVPYALFAGNAATSSPTGSAGGDLSGNYPNPDIKPNAITSSKLADSAVVTNKLADNSVTTPKIADASVTSAKLAAGVIPTTLPPGGSAGGDLTGTYPNPTITNGAIISSKLANNSVTTLKIADASVTSAKLAAGVIPATLPPGGAAGGDLSGTYPNPTIKNASITSGKLANNSVTTLKIADASVTSAKLAAGVIPTTLPPGGAAGGDLTGTYPNPTIANSAITTIKLADNAVTTSKIPDGSITMAKLGLDVVLGGGNPTGPAGGDLSGTYPNPNISPESVTIPKIANGAVITPKIADGAVNMNKLADNSVSTSKIIDASVTAAKLAAGIIPTSLPPNGVAGGELSGTYPNPTVATGVITTSKLADNSVSTSKIINASVTAAKLAAGIIPTSLPPNGVAGGELSGTFPNPTIATGVITTSKLADNSVTTSKVVDGSITLAKLGSDVVLGGGGSPTGAAGGELAGSYPNPTIATGVITTSKLADNSVSTSKIINASVTSAKLAAGIIPTSLPPNGVAGGELSGTYPNPTIATGAITNLKLADNSVSTSKIIDASVTAAKLAAGIIPTSLPPNGTAGGELSGTYPNPTIATGVITTSKLADNSVSTSKIIDASVTAAKLAAGIIPTSLPPNGTAGGDLTGTYPNPSVHKLQGITVSNTAPGSGQVLKFNGTQWAPGADNAAGLTLPFSTVDNNSLALFSLSNQGTGAALEGINTSTSANTIGVVGKISSTAAGNSSTGVRGIHNGTGGAGTGVWGSHNGFGTGVYGHSISGNGVHGNSTNETGVIGTSTNGAAGYFDISNASSLSDALFAYNAGYGSGLTAIGENGHGVWGTTFSSTSAGVLGYNFAGGEGIVGNTSSNSAAAIVGRNSGTFAGVQGIGAADGATGVLAIANADGYINGNALVAAIEGSDIGNPAVFKANGANVARIDNTGKGFFNGGTQVGGADVAEYFDVEGEVNSYEPGDVLVISQLSDRTVEKSSVAYSTLVAGIYATKPGLLLTDKNAEQNQLDGMVPMGVIGVIPTKVCLEGGAIKRGDLIVTSSIKGVAMKADPDKVKPGQIIGKALQGYNGEGIEKITVLVSIK